MVEFNAVQLRDALNEVAGSLQRIPAVLYSKRVQESAKIITELMNNVSALGRNVSESFVNATRENTAPVQEVFAALQKSSDTLKSFLESNSSKFVAELGLQVGNVGAEEFKLALININNATVKTEEATTGLEGVIGNNSRSGSIPGELIRELASSLGDLRDQVRILRNTVDATVNSIQTANSQLENVRNVQVSTGNALNTSFDDLLNIINSESNSAIIKYQTGIKNINNELAGAVKRLTPFTSDSSLLLLQDSISESFTRTYYALLNRDEPDVFTIKQTFQTLRYKMSDLLRSTSQQLFSDIQTTTESLASMILTRSAASERCTPLLSPRILGTFGPMHGDLVNCINRERGRLSRITDSVDKVMQLLQVTAADFSSDIGSCSRFGAFATDRAEFVRAKGCLETVSFLMFLSFLSSSMIH